MLPTRDSIFDTMVTREAKGLPGRDKSGEKTPLSVFKLCEMEVLSKQALDISGNPYIIIGYLLRIEYGDLGSKFVDWLAKVHVEGSP